MARVLVIGSGLAGLVAAVRASDAGHTVDLITKAALAESNTRYAQGGIAAALFPDDSVDAHVLDTLLAGAGLCDPEAVRVLCAEGPARVRDLIRFGVDFDRDDSGVARGLEAAHSRSRVLHAGGDRTGAVVEAALVATARQRAARPDSGLTIHEHTMLVDLQLSNDDNGERVTGVRLRAPSGRDRTLHADAVILATGGAGALYEHTTNPAIATGDGVAAAWRAGAELADLEFYQFHPTALFAPGTPLVSEAVRGEGAVLRGIRDDRFMPGLHPDAELAPRDVVARSIAREMARQGGEPVRLDATALGRELLESRFPTITAACRAAGWDWALEPVPVAPAAHYWMGGIRTDTWGQSSLPGLFAVGEVARTGAHGANRLASNSLLEAAVFADRAVRALDASSPAPARVPAADNSSRRNGHYCPQQEHLAPDATIVDRTALQHLMWEAAGVHRTGSGLAAAAETLAEWRSVDSAEATTSELEDRNLLDLARLVVRAALARQESRGAHHRADFPLTRPELAHSRSWQRDEPLTSVPLTAREAITC